MTYPWFTHHVTRKNVEMPHFRALLDFSIWKCTKNYVFMTQLFNQVNSGNGDEWSIFTNQLESSHPMSQRLNRVQVTVKRKELARPQFKSHWRHICTHIIKALWYLLNDHGFPHKGLQQNLQNKRWLVRLLLFLKKIESVYWPARWQLWSVSGLAQSFMDWCSLPRAAYVRVEGKFLY